MSDTRVFVDMDLAEGLVATLPPKAYHHLVVVLRRIPGDRVTLFNGRGGEYSVAIESVARRHVSVKVLGHSNPSRESPLHVTLGQAVSKGDRMDYSIQKAVELGVAEIQPLITDRVVVRLDSERWERKRERWQDVATSACEQCGRNRVPHVAMPVDLRDWLNTSPPDELRLVLAPGAGVAASAIRRSADQAVRLLIGPEGGLSEVELELAGLASYTSLSLGPRVLRTETAAVVALSVLQSLWGDLRK